MTKETKNAVRPLVKDMAKAAREGRMDRREFMALASVLGASAATASGLLGLSATPAQADTPKKGGVLKIGMRILDIADPRLYDWTEKGNVARQFCEPLVRWEPDFSFTGMLAETWEVSDDAKTYVLNLRRDAMWNNGDPFIADHVIFNLERWCDKAAEGNSMAARMASLIDDETGQARDGAIVKIDDHTVQLNLLTSDITIIPGMSDYPALIIHPASAEVGLADAPIGTGPFELDSFEIGVGASVKRRENGAWWGGDVHLDGVEFIDYGTDTAPMVSAFEAGEIHVNDQTTADFVEVLDSLGTLVRQEKVTGNTIVARMRADTPPYDDKRVRNAIQLAVDNSTVLALGFNGLGSTAENHHVGPMHPEYAELPVITRDVEAAQALLAEAGHTDTEFELISIDGDWRRDVTDVIGGQMRDAGMNISRNILPGSTFWNDWTKYPFSTTNWGPRPLGVQVYGLAYRSGEAWNESGHANPEFDAKLSEAVGIFDPDKRRALMAELQQMLQDSGAIIQPFWANEYLHHVPEVKNYERHQFREMHLENVWLDV